MRWIGIALIVLGIVGLVLGGFSVTEEETKAEIGPLKVKVQEEKRFPIPPWVSIVGIAAGLVLVVVDVRNKK